MNNIFSTFKPHLLFAVSISFLLITQTAHADFRKALDAYIARDGATMLKEVKDAVNKKNDDGLILFLSVLELDKTLVSNDVSLSKEELTSTVNSKKSLQAPIEVLLDDEGVKNFFLELEKAAKKSSFESQYRFYWLGSLSKVKMNFDVLAQIESDGKFPSPTNYEFSKAISYLLGQGVVKNEVEGMRLLKQAIGRPDAQFYWGRFSNKLSRLYYEKYLQKKDLWHLRQAYAWAIIDLTSNGIRTFGIQDIVDEMQKQDLLVKAAPEMDVLLSTMPENLKNEKGLSDRQRVRKRNEIILKNIKTFELPDLIKKNHKNDLKKQPVISFRRVVGENVMDGNVVAGLSNYLNYYLEIYEDGRVNFNLGPKGTNGFYRTNNLETLVKISPEEVNDLHLKIKNLGFAEEPLFNFNSLSSCISTLCLSYLGNNMGSTQVVYFITLRDRKGYRTIKFKGRQNDELPQTFTKVFQLLEQKIPTQQYRCGTNKERAYYQYCVSREKELFENSKQGESK
jgi:hypothetical protein